MRKHVIIGNQTYGSMESRQKRSRSCWVLAYSFDPTQQRNSTATETRLGSSAPWACKVRRYIEVTCKVSGTLRKVLFADIRGLGHHQHYNYFPLPTTVWSPAECDGNIRFLPVDLFICQLAHTISKVKFNDITEETVGVGYHNTYNNNFTSNNWQLSVMINLSRPESIATTSLL